MAKKISNVEVRFYNLQTKNVIATSGEPTYVNQLGNGTQLVGGRDYYDEEEW